MRPTTYQTQASQLEQEQQVLNTTGHTGHRESTLSVYARLQTLLLFHYTRTHTNVQKPGTYSQNKFLSPPGFLEFSWVSCHFFGSLARLNRISDLMFNAWRTAAVAALFFPGERGVITLAIK
jgi:hypothetical protein